MIKEEKVLTETIKKHRYCDECGKEIRWIMACSVSKCQYCGKDLCEDCIGNEEETGGDYRLVYCKRCWELGNDYRPKIDQLHEEIDKLYKEWQTKCKDKL